MTRLMLILLFASTIDTQTLEDRRACDAAAARGLETLAELAHYDAKTTGITSAEALNAYLLAPLPVSLVSPERLQRFAASDDPAALLDDVVMLWYPIAVGDKVRAIVTVQKLNGVWVASRIGSANTAKRIAELQRELPRPEGVVFIPGLNLHFLRSGERLASFDRGEIHEARALFRSLIPRVRELRPPH
jgi:hypothetical protein